jgi:hypothetical protein
LVLRDISSGLARLGLRLGPAQVQFVFDYLADGEADQAVSLPRFREVSHQYIHIYNMHIIHG